MVELNILTSDRKVINLSSFLYPDLTHSERNLLARGEDVLEDIISHLVDIDQLLSQPSVLEEEGKGEDRQQCQDRVGELLQVLQLNKDIIEREELSAAGLPMTPQLEKQELAYALMEKFCSLQLAIEKLLIQRFQCVGGVSHFLSVAPIAVPDPTGALILADAETAKEMLDVDISESEAAVGTASLPKDHIDPPVAFEVGQVVHHKLFDYKGVCVGWDMRPSADTSQWEGVKDSQFGTEQPYYAVCTYC